MNVFLKKAKRFVKESLIYVIGNESCDLDSAVCAISLAYFYSKTKFISNSGQNVNILPVMNIQRANLPLKTEVTYFLREHNIDVENLICRDEIPHDSFQCKKFILVDHHVPSKSINHDDILEVIDHRPIDITTRFPDDCKLNIKQVGSCASLVAKLIFLESNPEAYIDILKLLHGPIVLDTINFTEAADKARPLDIEVNQKMEELLKIGAHERNALYQSLIHARSDVASLNSLQLLSKDLKVISNQSKGITVAIPGYPILVEEYVQREKVLENLHLFGKEKCCDAIVLMGMKEIENNGIRRDIGLIGLRENTCVTKILENLLESTEPNLELKPKGIHNAELSALPFGRFFDQLNLKASRKQVLPIVQKTIDSL